MLDDKSVCELRKCLVFVLFDLLLQLLLISICVHANSVDTRLLILAYIVCQCPFYEILIQGINGLF